MFKLFCAAALAMMLGGCAALNNLNNEVSTFGPWPADRKPSSFAFERLPSQQAHPEHQQQLEDAARGAIEAAGFSAAPDLASADYLMQVGARVSSNDPWIYNEPLFWHGGFRYGYGYNRWGWGRNPYWGAGSSFGPPGYGSTSFDREVALLIRDRKTGQLLYEARAANTGPSASIDYLLPAMFEAALKEFPNVGPNPHTVTTQITKQ
jgi:hypothetical protein